MISGTLAKFLGWVVSVAGCWDMMFESVGTVFGDRLEGQNYKGFLPTELAKGIISVECSFVFQMILFY